MIEKIEDTKGVTKSCKDMTNFTVLGVYGYEVQRHFQHISFILWRSSALLVAETVVP